MSVIHYKTLLFALILVLSVPANSQETGGADTNDINTAELSDNLETDAISTGGQSVSSSNTETPLATDFDIVLLWEESSPTQTINTGQFLSKLISLGPSVQVGIIGFLEQVNVIQPLASANELNQETILNALHPPSEGSAVVDLGRALERVIYELKYNGRQAADKVILMLSNPGQGSNRPYNTVIPLTIGSDILEFNIRLIAVTTSDMVMNNLTQALNGLQQTAIHMIYETDELNEIIDTVLSASSSPDSPLTVRTDIQEQAADIPQVTQVQAQAPVNTSIPASAPAVGREEKERNIIIVIAAGILILTLGALIVLLYIRVRKITGAGNVEISEAYLKDIDGYTSNELYRLGKKATMLGRVAGKDSENLDFIVIPETTIGRRHAVIEYKDYAYWIIDQGSINGTFVNNIPVTSEVRLKQGDIVRLHKFEFEFSIPDLDEAGMTKVSNTVLAEHSPEEISLESPEVSEVKENISSGGLDLDLGFGDTTEGAAETAASAVDETLLPDQDEAIPDDDSENETLMPDSNSASSIDLDITGQENPQEDSGFKNQSDDETIRPGNKSSD